jgi:diadenosine tetraphosphatase ApaH/serine/threonine PP2A family protein phosphatase
VRSRQLVAESVGTALLLAAVVGSGIMGERLADGNVAVALLVGGGRVTGWPDLVAGGRILHRASGICRRSRQSSQTPLPDHSIGCTAWVIWVGYGHTHKPYTKLVDDVWFVNVGSVGKPKDGDWRGCCATLDTLARTTEFVRVEYDLPRVTSAIGASELPTESATDLETAGAQTPVR